MKRTVYLFLFLLLPAAAIAQVLNGGFETSRPDGSLANWEAMYRFSIPLGGTACTDTLYGRSTDAHSGNYALLLRTTACDGHLALQRLAASDELPAFSPGEAFRGRPGEFYLYYKFLPAGGDRVRILIGLDDTAGNEIGSAEALVSDTALHYTRLSLPLSYSSTGDCSRLRMYFLPEPGGDSLHAATLFLADDIGTAATAVVTTAMRGIGISVIPGETELLLQVHDFPEGPQDISLFDVRGRLLQRTRLLPDADGRIRLPAATYGPGFYVLGIRNAAGSWSAGFYK